MAASPDDEERPSDLRRQRDAALRFISHDMRSPQSSILSLLELYDRSPPDKRDIARLHERIRGYARLALDLSEDFLQIARAEADGIDRRPHDLHGVLDEAADSVWARARERQIRIVLPEADEEAECEVDRMLLARALALLLAGAVDSAERGAEIRCAISARATREPAGARGWQLSLHAPTAELAEDIAAAVRFAQLAVQWHGGSLTVAGADAEGAQPGTEFIIRLPRDGKRDDAATNDEQPLPV